MGLSTHELWLVLRARDEATRILKGATAGMLAAHTATTSGQISSLKKLMATEALQTASNVQGLRLQNASSNERIRVIRRSAQEALDGISLERASLMAKSNMDKDLRRVKLAGLTKERAEITASRNTEIRAIQDVMAQRRDSINTLQSSAHIRRQISQAEIDDLQRILAQQEEQAAATHRQSVRLQQVGGAFVSAGIGATVFGATVSAGLYQATKATMEYRQAASKTYTQVDKQGVSAQTSLNDVMRIGTQVAGDFAVKFEQIQPALYDVFSTLEVTGAQAQAVLEGIAKASIGGATDMETAGRSVMGIMNAWHLQGKTVEETTANVTHVNDIMFQLVRKGTGDYNEFAAAIGKATPSTVKAGQSVETLASMLAFMTKNGMTSAQAGTSAARAFDMLSNPKFADNIKKFGVEAFDSAGKIRPMGDVVEDLRQKAQSFTTDQERMSFIKAIGLGAGGTIQAMRFMNLGMEDSKQTVESFSKELSTMIPKNQTLFQQMQDAMGRAGGETERAYEIMRNTPEAKIQGMSNQWEIFKNVLGTALLPVLMAVVGGISTLLEWFNNLSPGMQQSISMLIAFVAAASVIVGIVSIIVGALLMFKATLLIVGASAMLTVGGIVLAISLIIGAIIAVAAFWPQISEAVKPVIDSILGYFEGFAGAFREKFAAFEEPLNQLKTAFKNVWDAIVATIEGVINNPLLMELQASFGAMTAEIGPKLEQLGAVFQLFGGAVANIFGVIIEVVGTFAVMLWAVFGGVVSAVVAAAIAGFSLLWSGIQIVFSGLISILTGVIQFLTGVFTGNWQMVVDGILNIVNGFVTAVVGVFVGFVGFVSGIISGFVGGIIAFFMNMYDVIVGHSIVPDMVNAIIKWFQSLPGKVGAFVSKLVGDVVKFFTDLAAKAKAKASELVSGVVTFFSGLPGKALSAIASLAGSLAAKGTEWMNRLKSAVSSGYNSVQSFFSSIPGKIRGALGSAGGILVGIGSSIINGLLRGLKSAWGGVTSFVGGIASWIRNNKGPIEKDRKLLIPAGNAIMGGFGEALQNGFSAVKSKVSGMGSIIVNSVANKAMSEAAMFMDVGIVSGQNLVNGLLSMESKVANAAARMNTAATVNMPEAPVGALSTTDTTSDKTGNVVNVTVNTQEIDAVKTSADLGYELSKRLGW